MATKRQEATIIVRKHVLWAIGGGLLPLPILDLAAVTAIQIDMLRQLAEHYQVDYDVMRGKAFVSALSGSALASVGASLIKGLPFVGTFIGGLSMSALSGASTYAVGEVAADIFQSGKDLWDADLKMAKDAYDRAFEHGKEVVEELQEDQGYQKTFNALERLHELKEKGVISEEEYEAKRKKLLNDL